MFFEWMSDPTAWLGLATLIVLEVVLGIDNLVFIAILAAKLPAHQQDRARVIGLTLAMVMRLLLLASIAWVVTLTKPLFTVYAWEISGRDLILILGGIFLLYKATTELHERLEGAGHPATGKPVRQVIFWQVLIQIVVLDAVFSLDSVITAVGMVDDVGIMMIAVVVAMGLMILASRPLMVFVSRHPTVVMLCLGLLLMIGFSLVAEGIGFHIPKGYLYAAIGFSILIEAFNQLARRNTMRSGASLGGRDRTAQLVLRLLRAKKTQAPDRFGEPAPAGIEEGSAFDPEESTMVERVLSIGTRDVRSIMIARREMIWLDIRDSPDTVQDKFARGHSRLPLCDGDPANVIGVVHFKDVLEPLHLPGAIDLVALSREPRYVSEATPVLKLLDQVKKARDHLLIVVDEHGTCQGLVTPMDVLTAVVGELPEYGDEQSAQATQLSDATWLLDGRLSIDEASRLLETPTLARAFSDVTLAGCLLSASDRIPRAGERVEWLGWEFEITRLRGLRVDQVRASKLISHVPSPSHSVD